MQTENSTQAVHHTDGTLIAFTKGDTRFVSNWHDFPHKTRTAIDNAIQAERLAAVKSGLYSTILYTIRTNEGHDRVFLAYVPFEQAEAIGKAKQQQRDDSATFTSYTDCMNSAYQEAPELGFDKVQTMYTACCACLADAEWNLRNDVTAQKMTSARAEGYRIWLEQQDGNTRMCKECGAHESDQFDTFTNGLCWECARREVA